MTFLAEAKRSKASEKEVTERIDLLTRGDDNNILIETRDRRHKGAWIPRNYIRK